MIARRTYLTVSFVLVISVGALLIAALPSRAVETLPTQISDSAFWTMISDFSEEGGYFRYENFLSNELAFQDIIPSLQQITKPGGVYLGVGPEQNFTYLVAIEPKIAFIIDIRRQNMLEHMMYKALFEISADRAEFLSRLFSRKPPLDVKADMSAEALFRAYQSVEPDRQLYKENQQRIKDLLVTQHKFGLTVDDLEKLAYVYSVFFDAGPHLDYSFGGFGGSGMPTYADLMSTTDEQGENRSYLASEENFRLVKGMEEENLIVPLVGDFAGPTTIRRVAEYLKEHDARVTVFYTSNVEQYLFQQGADWRHFYSSVATLPVDSTSTFIRSISGGGFSRGYGFRFQSVLASMPDLIKGYEEGRIRNYNDVIELSK